MNLLRYLRFLPFLSQLVEFVRQAETEFRGSDSGAQKLAFVQDKFIPIIESAGSIGLIPPKLADAIVAGSSSIITIIVQIMNASGGVPTP